MNGSLFGAGTRIALWRYVENCENIGGIESERIKTRSDRESKQT